MEEWAAIEGFEGLYEISDLGRVRSIDRIQINSKGIQRRDKGRILTLVDRGNDYLFVSLSKNNKKHNFSVHTGVAQAFIPNPENRPQVNHKDGDKRNNVKTNLEWATAQENSIHAFENNLRISVKGESHGGNKLTEMQVLEIRRMSTNSSHQSIADMFDVSRSAVSKIVRRDMWKHI